MTRPAFWKTVNSLAHPVSLAAVLLLLLNDHVLRYSMPSWWTGKLGDFAWLIFPPMICSTLLAWIVPQKWVGPLAFTLIGLWFTTAKTVPAVHHVTVTVLNAIVGWQTTLRLDPTDLITLPALLIGWYVWINAPSEPLKLTPRGLVFLSLGMIGTLADSPGIVEPLDNIGVQCITQAGGDLIILAPLGRNLETDTYYGQVFVSKDGGLTWEYRENAELDVSETHHSTQLTHCESHKAVQVDTASGTVMYRYGDNVEKSLDDGKTWHTVYSLKPARQDVRIYYYRRQARCAGLDFYCNSPYQPEVRPQDFIYHQESGNILLAMDWGGILVGTPEGSWQWVKVGIYGLENLNQIEKLDSLLFHEFWTGIDLICVVVISLSLYTGKTGQSAKALLIMCWLCWGSLLLFLYFLGSSKLLGFNSLLFFNVRICGDAPLAYRLGRRCFFDRRSRFCDTQDIRSRWRVSHLVHAPLRPMVNWQDSPLSHRDGVRLHPDCRDNERGISLLTAIQARRVPR